MIVHTLHKIYILFGIFERRDTVMQQVGVTEARGKFGELVDLVRYRGDTIVLVKSGKPAAALVPFEWLERYRKDRAAAFQVVADVRAQNEDIAEEELQTLINEGIQAVRQQKR